MLQTLTLIQRSADDPQQVVRLARAQERELRAWLFDRPGARLAGRPATTLADGIAADPQEVDAQHGIPVEVVIVGDCDLDERLRALLARRPARRWSTR